MPGQMASIMMQLVQAMGGRAVGNTAFHSEVPIQYVQKHESPPQYQPEKTAANKNLRRGRRERCSNQDRRSTISDRSKIIPRTLARSISEYSNR